MGGFILSNSQRIMNISIGEINGFFNNDIYYRDNDSLYIEKNFWDVLDKAKVIGEDLCQWKMIMNQKASLWIIPSTKKKILFNNR